MLLAARLKNVIPPQLVSISGVTFFKADLIVVIEMPEYAVEVAELAFGTMPLYEADSCKLAGGAVKW